MYTDFSVVAIDPYFNKKQIVITMTKNINKNNFNEVVIDLIQRTSKEAVTFLYEIQGTQLIINFVDWPLPNTEYILSVKGLKSIVDEEVTGTIKKRIVFNSSVVSKVSIINPVMYEQIEAINLELKETADEEKNLINSYYIEIAKDNAFIDVVVKTFIKKNIAKLSLPTYGQYFIRARVQLENDSDQYGLWSDVISFRYGKDHIENDSNIIDDKSDEDIYDDNTDSLAPIVELDEFKVISNIEQGITPNSLLLEFSKGVDQLSLENLVIIRKVVK